MREEPLKKIVCKYDENFNYSDHDFTVKNIWSVHRILEEAFFNCDEEDRKRIEADVIASGRGKLWKRYMDAISKNVFLSKERVEADKDWYHYTPEKYDDNTYIMNKDKNAYIWYHKELDKRGLYHIDVKTQQEAVVLLMAYDAFADDIRKTPAKSTDSNASRKGAVTRQAYIKWYREEIIKMMVIAVPSKTAKRLTKELIDTFL